MIDFKKCIVCLVGASKVSLSAEHGGSVATLKAPARKTVHFTKLIIEIEVVQNRISDNFYFEEYPVQLNSKVPIFWCDSLREPPK